MTTVLAEYVFEPADQQREAVAAAVDALIGALVLNGQVWGEPVVGWVAGCRYVVCRLPRPDALADTHASSRVRQELARATEHCASTPRWRLLADQDLAGAERGWQAEACLYLFTHAFDESSPVCAGSDGAPLPLYTLPVDDLTRERLSRWTAEYRRHDHVQLDCGPLERAAYHQLAAPASELATEGRALAAAVERACARPTYYYLLRYWGRDHGEASRPCPGCGQPWSNPSHDDDGAGLIAMAFRCEPCRLVSTIGSALDEDGKAQLGDWPPPG